MMIIFLVKSIIYACVGACAFYFSEGVGLVIVILTFEPPANMSKESNLSAVLKSVGNLQLVSERFLSFIWLPRLSEAEV